MRKKGYLFAELIIVLGLFSIVIFPLVMLMDKNIKSLNFIREDYEIRKITKNLETVFEKILKTERENLNFSLLEDKTENGNFILLNSRGEKITKFRNIRINKDIKISVKKRKILAEDSKKDIGEIFILEIKTGDRIKKRILSVQSDEKR
ncbi:hypothetical protein HUW86_07615 [Fusobacterium sp. SB021]|uniref:hypothetical protein n=1 Tax=Fusobacterium sp. SB021 TaxID=2744227 RepID=UPI003CEFE800